MQSTTSDNTVIHGLIDIPKQEAIILLEAGYFLMQLNKKQEAKEIFLGACELFPHSDVPCIALGHLYLSEGKATLAVKEHKRALKRVPTSATAQAHLGEALLFQRKIEEGIEALKQAIAMDPKGLPAKLAQELLRAHELHVFDIPKEKE